MGLGILTTELIAWPFVNVLADSFKRNWNYLLVCAGAILCRFLIVVGLLPAFHALHVTKVSADHR